MTDYELAELRALRAGVEALADPDRMPSDVQAFATRQDRVEISRYIQSLLASSAPATASEVVNDGPSFGDYWPTTASEACTTPGEDRG